MGDDNFNSENASVFAGLVITPIVAHCANIRPSRKAYPWRCAAIGDRSQSFEAARSEAKFDLAIAQKGPFGEFDRLVSKQQTPLAALA
jgi:hypothetical protein